MSHARLLAALLLLATPLTAQTFRPIGPDGGTIQAIAADPSAAGTVYTGTHGGGVFKTTDAGASWKAAGLGGHGVLSLAVKPTAPATLYAGTDDAGLFRSTDGAVSWTALAGIPGKQIDVLAVEPSESAVVYAAYSLAPCPAFPCRRSGVARSTDDGASWTLVNESLEDRRVATMVIRPRVPYGLFLALFGTSALYFSDDRGGHWTKEPDTILSGAHPAKLFIATDVPRPAARAPQVDFLGDILMMGSEIGLSKAELQDIQGVHLLPFLLYQTSPRFRSYIDDILRRAFAAQEGHLAPSAAPASVIYGSSFAGVTRSTDEGATWQVVNNGLDNPNIPRLGHSSGDAAFAAAYGTGLYRSTDFGDSWSFASAGLAATQVVALRADDAGTLYTAFTGGVSRSTDDGASWTLGLKGLVDSSGEMVEVARLTVSGGGPATLYAGTGRGVYRSLDGGANWAPATTGLGSRYVSAIAVDPSTPATVYAIGGSIDSGTLYKTTNAGATWTALTGLSNASGLAVDPRAPATLFSSTGGRFQRSTDGGATWSALANDHFFNSVSSLELDLTTSARLLAGTDRGLFRSTDGGATWKHASALQTPDLNDPKVTATAVDPRSPITVYAATESNGLYRSLDGGSTWTPFNSGLGSSRLRALLFAPSGALLAGTDGAGVFALGTDSGTTLLLPSSARVGGAGGSFFSTGLTVANVGTSGTTFTLKFLGHDGDGRGGDEKTFALAAGRSITFGDVLGTVFGRESDYGAIRITSPSSSLLAISQTSTPGFGGTFGQSVPAARASDLVAAGTPRSILAVREDDAFRTNLILANAGEQPLDVDVSLVADSGSTLGSARFPLLPLGMRQVSRVVRALGVAGDVRGARLTLSTTSAGRSFAAYAAVIDNGTNDPRTLLPLGPVASDNVSADVWLLPSSARASGLGGAFYSTDLTVAYTHDVSARFTLKFLGHDTDGTGAPEQTFDLAARRSATYADVLGTVFQKTSDYGAIRVLSRFPESDSAHIAVLSQTSTPGFGGTFGQSVPAATAEDLIRAGTERSILAVEEDEGFRTNLILANATAAELVVDVRLVSEGGETLGTKSYPLPALGMRQVSRVVRDLGVDGNLAGARLVLSTPTGGGAFAAYASAIDNVTQDPRTLLPR